MTELTDLSETDASNTTITTADIAEGCAPSGINNAIRNTLGLIRRAFKASIFRIRDTTDQTKLLAFDLSGIATATTRTITIPDYDMTLGVGLSTAQTLASSGVTFTGIPSWARRVRIMMVGASLTGTGNILIRLGDSGGVESTDYTGSVVQVSSTPAVTRAGFSSGFQLTVGSEAAAAFDGALSLDLIDPSINRWVISGDVGTTLDARFNTITGYKSLSGALDRIQILQNASDTFDSGQVNISWE